MLRNNTTLQIKKIFILLLIICGCKSKENQIQPSTSQPVNVKSAISDNCPIDAIDTGTRITSKKKIHPSEINKTTAKITSLILNSIVELSIEFSFDTTRSPEFNPDYLAIAICNENNKCLDFLTAKETMSMPIPSDFSGLISVFLRPCLNPDKVTDPNHACSEIEQFLYRVDKTTPPELQVIADQTQKTKDQLSQTTLNLTSDSTKFLNAIETNQNLSASEASIAKSAYAIAQSPIKTASLVSDPEAFDQAIALSQNVIHPSTESTNERIALTEGTSECQSREKIFTKSDLHIPHIEEQKESAKDLLSSVFQDRKISPENITDMTSESIAKLDISTLETILSQDLTKPLQQQITYVIDKVKTEITTIQDSAEAQALLNSSFELANRVKQLIDNIKQSTSSLLQQIKKQGTQLLEDGIKNVLNLIDETEQLIQYLIDMFLEKLNYLINKAKSVIYDVKNKVDNIANQTKRVMRWFESSDHQAGMVLGVVALVYFSTVKNTLFVSNESTLKGEITMPTTENKGSFTAEIKPKDGFNTHTAVRRGLYYGLGIGVALIGVALMSTSWSLTENPDCSTFEGYQACLQKADLEIAKERRRLQFWNEILQDKIKKGGY